MEKFRNYVPTNREGICVVLAWLSGGRLCRKVAERVVNKRRERWARYCADMQWELNREHWNKLGWRVNERHEVVVDRF